MTQEGVYQAEGAWSEAAMGLSISLSILVSLPGAKTLPFTLWKSLGSEKESPEIPEVCIDPERKMRKRKR